MGTLLLIGWMLASPLIQASTPTTSPFRSLTPDDGFPTTAVHHVMQDRRGFIWLSTRHGVYRYDGTQYRPFRRDPTDPNSLSANTVWVTHEDRRGWIWMGTLGGGLTVYRPARGRFHRFTVDSTRADALPHHTVTALHEDGRGRMWVGTDGGGLSRAVVESTADSLLVRFRTFTGSAEEGNPGRNQVLDIAEDERGRLWLATFGGGVRCFDPEQGAFEAAFTAGAGASLSDNHVMSVALDEHDNLWVGTKYGGLNYLETRTGRVRPVPLTVDGTDVAFVWRTRVFDGSMLWVGTYGRGAVRVEYDGASKGRPRIVETDWYRHDARDPFSLADDFVLALFRDRTGVLWLGTDNNGVSLHLDRPYVRPAQGRLPGGRPAYRVRARAYAVDDAGRQWLGTHSGLFRRRTESAQYRSVALPAAASFVHRMREDENGGLWLCTNAGLYRQESETDRRIDVYAQLRARGATKSDRFFDLAALDDATYWAGTDDGLVAFSIRDGRVAQVDSLAAVNRRLVSRRIRRLEARDGRVWVGTTGGGLYIVDRGSENVRSLAGLTDTSQYATIKVLDWAFEADGTAWIATHGGGIVRLRPEGDAWAARAFTAADGLPDNMVKAVVIDETGGVWVSTNDGFGGSLSAKDPSFQPIPLPVPGFENTGRLFKSEDGSLFVAGGSRGLLRFDPDEYRTALTTSPSVAITDVRTDRGNRSARRGQSPVPHVTLAPDQRWILVRAAVLDFSWPPANRLRYRIRGRQLDWIPVQGEGPFLIGGLAPGQHVIEIAGRGLHGATPTPARLTVTVQPAFWETWWFRALVALAVIGVLVGAYRYRIRQVRRLERTRRRIADDLHDDVGSKVASVALLLDASQKRDRSAPLIERAARIAQEVIENLRDVVWIVESTHDDLTALVDRMRQMARALLPEGQVQFVVPDALPTLPLPMNVRRHLYLFYKEALHNAARHAEAEQVTVELTVTGRQLTLRVKDDGTGFDPATVEAGRGFQTLERRAQALDGTYDLVSEPGRGTRVELVLNIA